MKIAALVVLLLLLAVLTGQIYSFWQRSQQAEKQYQNLKSQLEKAEADYRSLQADFEYYLTPANLEKELRQKFNYHRSGENLIIVVPRTSSSTLLGTSSSTMLGTGPSTTLRANSPTSSTNR